MPMSTKTTLVHINLNRDPQMECTDPLRDSEEAETALQREGDQHKLLLDGILAALNDFVYGFDSACRLTFANQRLLDLWGLTAAQAVGKTLTELGYAEDVKAQFEYDLQQVTATGEIRRGVTAYTSATGVHGFFEYSLAPVFRADGQVSMVAGCSRDITARRRRERDLTFLADLQKALSELDSVAEILSTANARIVQHLQLAHCVVSEIDTVHTATLLYARHSATAPSFQGVYHLSDFHTEQEIRHMATGEPLVVGDVQRDLHAAGAARFATLGIRALLHINYITTGRWKFMLSALCGQPRRWLAEDISLLNDLALQICLRVERARAEDRLREREALLRAVTSAARVGLVLVSPERRYLVANEHYAEIVGLPGVNLAGQHMSEALKGVYDQVRPRLDRAFAGERVAYELRVPAHPRSGDERFYDVTYELRDRGNAEQSYLAITAVDITEHKQAHLILERTVAARTAELTDLNAALHASEQRLQHVLAASGIGLFEVDPKSGETYWNESEYALLGLKPDAAVGPEAIFRFVHPDDLTGLRTLWADAIRSDDFDTEFRIVRADGATRWLASKGRFVSSGNGPESSQTGTRHRRFLGVNYDITARKRLEAEVLRISEDERMRVAADLHDGICQELAGIKLFTHLLRQKLESESSPLVADAARIEAMTISALEHTRQVAHGMNPVVADGSGLLHALRQLAETACAPRLRCSFECPRPVSIENKLVANELYRIAQEAFHNAVQHSNARRITLRLSETNGEVRLTVLDNGDGLPAAIDEAPGMGLRLMRYRAGLIGARISIESRKRGGTAVICRVANLAVNRAT
jgi:PAS domain S-box-containing protein